MTIIFKGLPEKPSSNSYDDIRRFGTGLLNGKMNIVGAFKIASNTTETLVDDRNIGENSFIGFVGMDEKSLSQNLYIKSRDVLNQTFTIGHDSQQIERMYSYVIIG